MRATLRSLLIGILWLLFLTLFSSACSNEKSKKPVSAPIPVTVDTSIQKTVPVQLRAIGVSRGMLGRNKEIRDKFL
jgi:hypothetical protein